MTETTCVGVATNKSTSALGNAVVLKAGG